VDELVVRMRRPLAYFGAAACFGAAAWFGTAASSGSLSSKELHERWCAGQWFLPAQCVLNGPRGQFLLPLALAAPPYVAHFSSCMAACAGCMPLWWHLAAMLPSIGFSASMMWG
jgi:hypothetical protein